ncbi:MAG TPA: glycosyltransferase 87 family protein [Chthoniobacteraceae bacterium]|jgi:hypothetical protein|nr:glycosyltransferase 87 family protein [Chthoniobacteraceae bacterium]
MGLPKLPRSVSLALLCAAVLLTRLPFLGEGYGLHADNWRVALAARHIAETGVYEASRFPGYPVQEYLCALFWKTGPWGLNFLDALFCAAAALAFALICLEYGMADWWLGGLAMAFVPVLYVNSVSTKDFPWALAFLLFAWWCAMHRRPALTGLLLGLAMGIRITSGAAALPIALILSDGAENRAALRRVITTGVIAAAVALAAFTPVYLRYGTEFFNFYAEHAFPDSLQILARMTIEVWGTLGVAGVCLALLAIPLARSRPRVSSRQVLAWSCMLVIYAIAFICLPDEAAYLIPAIPFTLLLLWRFTPRWAFQSCCALILLSPFLLPGLVLQDHRARALTDGQIGGFLHFASQISGRNAYIVGSWEPPIAVLTAGHPHPDIQYLYLVTQGELDTLVAKGWHVWYLPLMREFNYRVDHYDIADHGARPVQQLLHPGHP